MSLLRENKMLKNIFTKIWFSITLLVGIGVVIFSVIILVLALSNETTELKMTDGVVLLLVGLLFTSFSAAVLFIPEKIYKLLKWVQAKQL
jgi:multisubunit Na+/H+ antiporter MnhB subunit